MIRVMLVIFLIGVAIGLFEFSKEHEDSCKQITASTYFKDLPIISKQVIWVKPTTGVHAKIFACQKEKNTWSKVLHSPFKAVLGKAGTAAVGEKKEGDLKTPTGLYSLGEAFGTEPLAIKMDYKYITPEDKFIDDVHHKNYNTWVHGSTNAKSYETMHIPSYKMGLIVNYNMNPVQPGAGSAIFMHLWDSENKGTSGCIATDEKHFLDLLQWLDKKQNPYIFIEPN